MAMNLYEITFFFSLSLSPTGRPAFSPPLPAVEVSIGGQAVFTCSVLSNPPATVSWAFGHPPQPLSTNQRIVVANTTLTINNVRGSDEGFYECIANNSYGRNSTSGRLTIAGSNDSFQMGISVLVLVVSIFVVSYHSVSLILRIFPHAFSYCKRWKAGWRLGMRLSLSIVSLMHIFCTVELSPFNNHVT